MQGLTSSLQHNLAQEDRPAPGWLATVRFGLLPRGERSAISALVSARRLCVGSDSVL
jgi:hypothetical protein